MMKILFLAGQTLAGLMVLGPQKLVDLFPGDQNQSAGRITTSYANFGLIPYGHSMIGRLHFNKQKKTACENFHKDFLKNYDNKIAKLAAQDNSKKSGQESSSEYVTPWVIADRGDCSFVEKVRNIEEAGAGLAIIIDNIHKENVTRIVMSDDGSGAGLRIPSMMISNEDGQKILNWMQTASAEDLESIRIVASFDMRRPDNRVEYDVWFSATQDVALDFFQDFKDIDQRLGEGVLMTPRFVFWECKNCDDTFK